MKTPELNDNYQEVLKKKEDSSSELSFMVDEKTICEPNPILITNTGFNRRIHNWRLFIHYIFKTVVELEQDLDVWKWFKIPNYNGRQEVEALVQAENFTIYGGPQYTQDIYDHLKRHVCERIWELQFIVISKFQHIEFVTFFWTWSVSEVRVFDVLKTDPYKFYIFAAGNFNLMNSCNYKAIVTWEFCTHFPNYKELIYDKSEPKKDI